MRSQRQALKLEIAAVVRAGATRYATIGTSMNANMIRRSPRSPRPPGSSRRQSAIRQPAPRRAATDEETADRMPATNATAQPAADGALRRARASLARAAGRASGSPRMRRRGPTHPAGDVDRRPERRAGDRAGAAALEDEHDDDPDRDPRRRTAGEARDQDPVGRSSRNASTSTRIGDGHERRLRRARQEQLGPVGHRCILSPRREERRAARPLRRPGLGTRHGAQDAPRDQGRTDRLGRSGLDENGAADVKRPPRRESGRLDACR